MTELSYAAEQVRRFDNDRFLCTLFAPADRREALLILFAFNVEVARIREFTHEPLIGQMRLQWWRDAVDALYGAAPPPRHPVVEALGTVVRRYALSRKCFERLLDARGRDLDDDPPADVERLLAYADGTSVNLSLLALEILGVRDDAALAAGRAVGMGWALTGLLRAVPFHAAARRVYLPADMLRGAGVDVDRLCEGRPGPSLATVIRPLATVAQGFFADARRVGAAVARPALPALLPATLADGYLARLARAGFDPFARRLRRPGTGRYFRLALNAWRGRF
jgi:phytoene synthase